MSDQERKGTSTIIKGFSRRGTKTDLLSGSVEEQAEEPIDSTPADSENLAPEVESAVQKSIETEISQEIFSGVRSEKESFTGVGRLLSQAPLATLLPRIGDVRDLEKNRSSLLKRHSTLAQSRRENTEDRAGRLGAEELMLSQIVNWLGEEHGSDE